jgi:hypothetical protein
MVKKLINNPDGIVNDLIEGFIFINNKKVKRIAKSGNFVLLRKWPGYL